MAKQVGPVFFTGTIDGLIFYKLGDHYYIRSKGSYKSAKHMRRNPKYKRTMQQADRFGEASQLLQAVYYRQLPKAVRKHGLYGKLTGMINSWLYQGKSKEEVQGLLMAHLQQLAAAAVPAAPKEKAAAPSNKDLPLTRAIPQPLNNNQRPTPYAQSTTHPLSAPDGKAAQQERCKLQATRCKQRATTKDISHRVKEKSRKLIRQFGNGMMAAGGGLLTGREEGMLNEQCARFNAQGRESRELRTGNEEGIFSAKYNNQNNQYRHKTSLLAACSV